MTRYRIYLLDQFGTVASGSDAEFATDDDAIGATEQTLVDDAWAEIWNGVRRVGQVRACRAARQQT